MKRFRDSFRYFDDYLQEMLDYLGVELDSDKVKYVKAALESAISSYTLTKKWFSIERIQEEREQLEKLKKKSVALREEIEKQLLIDKNLKERKQQERIKKKSSRLREEIEKALKDFIFTMDDTVYFKFRYSPEDKLRGKVNRSDELYNYLKEQSWESSSAPLFNKLYEELESKVSDEEKRKKLYEELKSFENREKQKPKFHAKTFIESNIYRWDKIYETLGEIEKNLGTIEWISLLKTLLAFEEDIRIIEEWRVPASTGKDNKNPYFEFVYKLVVIYDRFQGWNETETYINNELYQFVIGGLTFIGYQEEKIPDNLCRLIGLAKKNCHKFFELEFIKDENGNVLSASFLDTFPEVNTYKGPVDWLGNELSTGRTELIPQAEIKNVTTHPVVSAVQMFMSELNESEWKGQASELYPLLESQSVITDKIKDTKLWPKNPQALSAKFNKLDGHFQKIGIAINTRIRTKKQRAIHIKWVTQKKRPSSN